MNRAKSIQEIDWKIAELWRMVDGLMAEADQKSAHVKRLRNFETPTFPLMASDTPVRCWELINEHYRTIGTLMELRMKLTVRRPRRKAA